MSMESIFTVASMPHLSNEVYLHEGAEISNNRFGRYVEIGAGSRIQSSFLDDYSYCDRYADIAYSRIGKFANIAAFARINPSQHPYERASLHHFMYRSSYYWPGEADEAEIFAWRQSLGCEVGHDTWIGHGAIIQKKVKIGNGAIVASGAVVTKDVPDYAIVAGVPANFLKWRHPERIAARLTALAWWDWDHERLRLALDDFRQLPVEAFLEKHASGS